MAPNLNRISEALENPKYPYRTIHGISEETGIPYAETANLMNQYVTELNLVKISRKNINQQDLYTTRSRYHKEESFLNCLKSIILNRYY